MIRYHINREERLLTLRYDGRVTVDQFRQTLVRALAECPEAAGFDTLSDGRAPHTFLKFEQVIELARMNRQLGMHDHARRAVGLVGSKAHFGLSRMFEMLTEGDSKVARFTTDSIQAAADWLCRPVEVIRAELGRLERSAVRKRRTPRIPEAK